MVLHTYGEQKDYHPHVHMIVSWGGVNIRTGALKEIKDEYVNYKFLQKKFRCKFEDELVHLNDTGQLDHDFPNREQFMKHIKQVNEKDWILHLEPAMATPEKVISYIVVVITAFLCLIFFCVFNLTHIHGWLNFKRKPGTVLVSNHRTMIDSFLIGFFGAFPWAFWKPNVILYHPAAAENFFNPPILAWFSRMWRCIPVKAGRRDPTAMKQIAAILPHNPVVVFPEGTRSRDGSIGSGKIGVGKLILDTNATVVPVFVAGMQKVLPIGKKYPRLFQRLNIYYGKPIDLSSYRTETDQRKASQQIVDRMMSEIRLLEEKHQG